MLSATARARQQIQISSCTFFRSTWLHRFLHTYFLPSSQGTWSRKTCTCRPPLSTALSLGKYYSTYGMGNLSWSCQRPSAFPTPQPHYIHCPRTYVTPAGSFWPEDEKRKQGESHRQTDEISDDQASVSPRCTVDSSEQIPNCGPGSAEREGGRFVEGGKDNLGESSRSHPEVIVHHDSNPHPSSPYGTKTTDGSEDSEKYMSSGVTLLAGLLDGKEANLSTDSPDPLETSSTLSSELSIYLRPKKTGHRKRKQPVFGPPTWAEHYWNQNQRGKLREEQRGGNTAQVRSAFRAHELKQGLREMLGQPYRAPGVTGRLHTFWTVLWVSGRVREPNFAALFAETLAYHGFFHDAHRVLSETRRCGVRLRIAFYEDIIHRVAQQENWTQTLNFIELARAHCGGVTRKILNWKLRALVEQASYAKLASVLDEFTQAKVSRDRRTYHVLIRGYLRNRDPVQSTKWVNSMVEAGFPVNLGTYAAILTGYGSLGLDEELERQTLSVLDKLPGSSNNMVLNSLIDQRLSIDDWQGARCVLRLFEPCPIPDAHDVWFDLPPQDPSDSPVKHAAPTATTFALLIEYLIKKSDFGSIAAFYRRMQGLGIEPSERVITALVSAHVSVGTIQVAGKIVFEMCRPHLPRALRTEFQLICGFSWNDSSLGFSNTKPTVKILNALLTGLLKTTGLRGALLLLHVMHSMDLQPDKRTLQLVLSFMDGHLHLEAPELSRVVTALSSSAGNSPSLGHSNAILQAILDRERTPVQRAGWKATGSTAATPADMRPLLFTGTVDDPTTPSDPTAGLYVTPVGGRAAFARILSVLVKRGTRSDQMTFALRIVYESVLEQDLSTARSVFSGMVRRGMRPNAYHFAGLMRGYLAAGNVAAAERVLEMLKMIKITPNAVLYTILIHGFGAAGKPDEARRIFDNMLNSGIRPDVAAIDALAGTYFATRQTEAARRTIIDSWHFVGSFPQELSDAPLDVLIARLRRLDRRLWSDDQMFSSDGSTLLEGGKRLPFRQRHRNVREITRTLVRTWKELAHPSHSLLRDHLAPPVSHGDRIGVFFASRFRGKVLRRLRRRIWAARQRAIEEWGKRGNGHSNGGVATMGGTQRARQPTAYVRLYPLEMRVLRTWKYVVDGKLRLRLAKGRPKTKSVDKARSQS